jgi:glutamate--cysteine ligase
MSKPMISGEDKAAFLDQPLRATPLDEVARFFLSSAKDPSTWLIGMEIELFAFHRATLKPVAHPTMTRVLESLGRRWHMKPDYEPSSERPLIGLSGHGAVISLEPGGQLELATKPHDQLKALRQEVCSYVDKLRAAGNDEDVGFWAMGYQPFEDRDSMPKLPRERYALMRSYFAKLGGRGLDMMHCTGSVQCAVDISDEKNMSSKIRTAARVSPFLAALVASSPFSKGKANGYKSMRYQIWLETDAERCGIWPEMLDQEGLTFRRYLQRAMNVPPLFFIRNGAYAAAERRPFADWVERGFEGGEVTVRDLVDHLTTMFPEIRPKGYIELRSTDCVKPRECVSVAGFWRGILDDEAVRREVDDRLSRMGYAELIALQPLVAKLGLSAMSAAGPVAEIAEWLVKLSYKHHEGAMPDCAECLEPLVERAESGRSPADELLEAAEKSSIEQAVMSCVV